MPNDSDDFKRLLLRVAFLTSQQLSQREVVEKLNGTKQPYVSKLQAALRGDRPKGKCHDARLAKRVQDVMGSDRWLVTTFLDKNLSPDLRKMLAEIEGADKLRSRLKEWG